MKNEKQDSLILVAIKAQGVGVARETQAVSV